VKVLMVAPQPFFSPRGTPLSVYYRTVVMAEKGASIDLLAYGEGEDVTIEGMRLVRIPRIPWMGAIPIGPSWKKFVLDILMFFWTIGLLVRNRYDAVHAHEESVFWCRFLKPIFRFRLIYDMHSSLPQQLSNFHFSSSKLLKRTFRFLEDTCLRKADAVVTICPDLKDYALSTGVPPGKHMLIENSIFDDVRVVNRDTASADTSQAMPGGYTLLDPSQPIILYAGTFEYYQGIDELIRAFAIVHRESPQARLLLVGGTAEQVAVAAETVKSLGLIDCAHLTGRVSKTAAMRYISLAHVLVSPRLHGTNTPLKIYEQLASGKPLVATRIWSHTQVLDDSVCILVDPNPESIASGLLRAINEPEFGQKLAAQARSLYERDYARPVYERKIQRLLEIVS
jgi:glycosyltransferase involved in cell wall biosynthesis